MCACVCVRINGWYLIFDFNHQNLVTTQYTGITHITVVPSFFELVSTQSYVLCLQVDCSQMHLCYMLCVCDVIVDYDNV